MTSPDQWVTEPRADSPPALGGQPRRCDASGVRVSRRWSVFLAAFGVWSWVIWPTFLKNIAQDPRSFSGDRPHAFFIVHLVLTVVSLVLGTAIGWLGIKGLRRTA
jgi:hypothetical protein